MLIAPEVIGPMLHQLMVEHFIGGRYRNIFQAIKKLQGQGRVPDPLTVNDALAGNYREILAVLMEVTPPLPTRGNTPPSATGSLCNIHLAELGE